LIRPQHEQVVRLRDLLLKYFTFLTIIDRSADVREDLETSLQAVDILAQHFTCAFHPSQLKPGFSERQLNDSGPYAAGSRISGSG